MSKIMKLSPRTINLISAGEVIECPADIIKELIENSIDSGADNISLTVRNSGIDLIKVQDNGSGINKEDLSICLDKYTTSKLKDINDLYSITSFGFRGEALSTISAVSHIKIKTSVNSNGEGYVLENKLISKISSIKGTVVTVEDLFYNLPVRKKFLKSKSKEFSKLYNVFLSFAIQNPQIKFIFNSEKKKSIFQKTTSEQRYYQVFGTDIKNKIIPVNIKNDLFVVKGIIGHPTSFFYYPTNFVYINNRNVFLYNLQKTITAAYKDYLMVQQKPFYVLSFEFDPKTIDINVHPKKKIVKLENEILFFSEFKSELSKILDAVISSNSKSIFKEKSIGNTFVKPLISNSSVNNYSSENKVSKDKLNNYNPLINTGLNKNNFNSKKQFFFENPTIAYKSTLEFNNIKIKSILGQILDTYIVCETENGMFLIDQHAAAERINLEINRLNIATNLDKQILLKPITINNLNEAQIQFLNTNKILISKLGFDYKLVDNSVYLLTMPVFFEKYFDKIFFISLIDDLKENPEVNINKVKDKIIKLRSCKHSIKANHFLTIPEQEKLIRDLDACKDKLICAHGRPTVIYYSKKDLDKSFKRII